MAEYRTKSGKLVSEADIERLADEAELGYDVDRLLGNSRPLGRPPHPCYFCHSSEHTTSEHRDGVEDDILALLDAARTLLKRGSSGDLHLAALRIDSAISLVEQRRKELRERTLIERLQAFVAQAWHVTHRAR